MASTDPLEVEQQLWHSWTGGLGLDVGARTGESIDDFLRCGFTEIVCFEPSAQAYMTLAERVRDIWAAEAHPIAVSQHCGVVELFSVPRAMAKGELVSMVDGMEWSLADWTTAEKVTVGCISLDLFCTMRGMPDLVKVDTEGHEAKVLAGASTLLTHGCGWIIEFHSPENHTYCSRRLEEAGYRVETIRHPHYAPESPMWRQHGWVRAEKGE
jgi:FkbM family methyltransferase